MANSFTTDITKWQMVDVIPVAGSKNLIESGALKYKKKNLIDYLLKNIKLGKVGTRVASVYGNEGVWAGTIKGIKLMSGDSVYLKSTGNAYVINGYITDADGYQISDLGNGEIRYKAATTCYLYIVARKSDSSALPSGWRDEIAADYIAEGYISSEEPTISYKTLSRISGNNYSVSEINNVDYIRTDYIKVSAGDTLTFNGRLSGISTNNNICGIAAFYKKDLSCFAGWLLNNEMEGETTDKNVDYTDKQVIVPAGVEYIIIDCGPNSSRPFNWFDMITITPTVNVFNYKEANVEWVYGALSNGTVITYNYQYPRIRTQEVMFMPAGSYITLRKSVQQVDIYLYDKKTFETTDRKISLTAQNNFRYIFKEDSYVSMALNIFNQRVPLDEVPEYVEVVRTNYNDYLSQDTILGFYSRRAYLGDMSFVILPNGENLVVDTYNSSDWNNVRATLYGNGISHIDNMVISHYHIDHVGNMLNMIENGMFDDKSTVYLPQMLDPNAQNPPEAANWASFCQSQDDIIAALTEVGSTIIHPTEGQIVTLCEEFNLKFINCDHSSYFGQTTDYNNWSLCCYLFVGENNIFYSGDIMNVAEATIAPNVVKTTILKAEHHGMDGGKNALVPAYINRIVPDVVIACDYSQHDVLYMQDISPMVSWCQSNSVSFYRTSENSGLIKVDINKDGWCFEGSTIRYIRNNKNWNFNDNLEYPLYDLSLFTKVGACGDSVTKGSMYKTDSWAGYRTDLAWHHILARNYGFKCYAFAVGGMSTETFITNPECLPKLLNTERLDLYFLFLGINDAIKYSTESNYLGTIADIHVGSPEQNPDSFYGNYGKIIETIQGYAPASLQIMMTVKYTEQYRGYITQINTAIKAIAALYGLPCIDLYNTPVYESSVYAQSLYGGHPTPILHSAIAKQIESSFYECVVKNTTYFDNYSTKYLSNGTFTERPAADSVPVGSTYWDTTNNCVWECNGIGADVSWIKIYDSTEQIE